MTTFYEKAPEMGLNCEKASKGLYSFSDQYSEVIYRELAPMGDGSDPTDQRVTPLVAIYTKREGNPDYAYAGYVSTLYKFVGNGDLVNNITRSVTSTGNIIAESRTFLSGMLTRFRQDMILSSAVNVREVGDVLPTIIIQNSYDGTKAATVSYGIAFDSGNTRIVHGFKLGEMRMIHLQSSATRLQESMTQYITTFRENIAEVITTSFNTQITETQMLATLDLIESIGKRKREEIAEILKEVMGDVPEGTLPSSWQMFVAIVKYASLNPNINVKRLLENAAESVLVIPQRMMDTLNQLS